MPSLTELVTEEDLLVAIEAADAAAGAQRYGEWVRAALEAYGARLLARQRRAP